MTAGQFKALKVGNLIHISTARLRNGHFIVFEMKEKCAILRPYRFTSFNVPFYGEDQFFQSIRRLA
jgi:hypothetical protein